MCWDGKRPSVWWWLVAAVDAPKERLRHGQKVLVSVFFQFNDKSCDISVLYLSMVEQVLMYLHLRV